jgi:FtsH-binding integral membrane protein
MLEFMIAFPCAVVGFIYASVLLDDGNILDSLGNYIQGKHADAVNEGRKFAEKFWLMLMCHLCVSGQLALWTYLIVTPLYSWSLPSLIFTICLSILLAKIFHKWS